MNQVTCEYIATARSIDRATVAEKFFAAQHKVIKCKQCEKFHIWVEVSSAEWQVDVGRRHAARLDKFELVGHNTYLHTGHKKKQAKKAGKKKVDDGNGD